VLLFIFAVSSHATRMFASEKDVAELRRQMLALLDTNTPPTGGDEKRASAAIEVKETKAVAAVPTTSGAKPKFNFGTEVFLLTHECLHIGTHTDALLLHSTTVSNSLFCM
jgi:hypothetical protein